MEMRGGKFYSVFVGGGTPSLVRRKESPKSCGAFPREVTLEANPGTLTPEKLEIVPDRRG